MRIIIIISLSILFSCGNSGDNLSSKEGVYNREEFENLFIGKPQTFLWDRLGHQDGLMWRGAFKKSAIFQYNEITYQKGQNKLDTKVLLFMSIDGNSVLEVKFY